MSSLATFMLLVLLCTFLLASHFHQVQGVDSNTKEQESENDMEDLLMATRKKSIFSVTSSLRRFASKLKTPGAALPMAVGSVVLAGGLTGYVKRGSVPSLVGSAVIGSGLVGGSALIMEDEELSGHAVAGISAGIVQSSNYWCCS
jgi:uncharacterized membrane protein (UPF0136 family)